MQPRLVLISACLALTLSGVAEPKVQTVTSNSLKQMIAARKGKVVLVNFWATWCQPCVEEFPDLVQLYNKYRKRGFDLIAVSFDDPDDREQKVVPFLRQHRATFTTVIFAGEDPDEFIRNFDPSWSGAIPRIYLYARSGKRVKAWTGKQTFGTFRAAVMAELKRRK